MQVWGSRVSGGWQVESWAWGSTLRRLHGAASFVLPALSPGGQCGGQPVLGCQRAPQRVHPCPEREPGAEAFPGGQVQGGQIPPLPPALWEPGGAQQGVWLNGGGVSPGAGEALPPALLVPSGQLQPCPVGGGRGGACSSAALGRRLEDSADNSGRSVPGEIILPRPRAYAGGPAPLAPWWCWAAACAGPSGGLPLPCPPFLPCSRVLGHPQGASGACPGTGIAGLLLGLANSGSPFSSGPGGWPQLQAAPLPGRRPCTAPAAGASFSGSEAAALRGRGDGRVLLSGTSSWGLWRGAVGGWSAFSGQ